MSKFGKVLRSGVSAEGVYGSTYSDRIDPRLMVVKILMYTDALPVATHSRQILVLPMSLEYKEAPITSVSLTPIANVPFQRSAGNRCLLYKPLCQGSREDSATLTLLSAIGGSHGYNFRYLRGDPSATLHPRGSHSKSARAPIYAGTYDTQYSHQTAPALPSRSRRSALCYRRLIC